MPSPPYIALHNLTKSKRLGKWNAGIPIPERKLEDTVTGLEGEKKEAFLDFVRGMLQWRPEDRKTAAQLVDDPWLRS